MKKVLTKIIILLLSFSFSLPIFADKTSLERGKQYVVPEGKVWIIIPREPMNCKVCTADIHLQGTIEIGANLKLTISGQFELSIASEKHELIKLLPGTKIWLGDSREELLVSESSLNQ